MQGKDPSVTLTQRARRRDAGWSMSRPGQTFVYSNLHHDSVPS